MATTGCGGIVAGEWGMNDWLKPQPRVVLWREVRFQSKRGLGEGWSATLRGRAVDRPLTLE
jgi:hypothetical protein